MLIERSFVSLVNDSSLSFQVSRGAASYLWYPRAVGKSRSEVVFLDFLVGRRQQIAASAENGFTRSLVTRLAIRDREHLHESRVGITRNYTELHASERVTHRDAHREDKLSRR
jgi:hypothetical protein